MFLLLTGKKQHVNTYFSHGKKEYDSSLMGKVKKQLKFQDSSKAENFFDCPMMGDEYIKMLNDLGEL